MARIVGWEDRLSEYIREQMAAPFAWGKNDCCLFAGDCIKIVSGHDLVEEYREQYETEEGAKKCLDKFGKGSLLSTVLTKMKTYGFNEIHKNYAQRGDMVYLVVDNYPALGIVDFTGRQSIGISERGLVTVPLEYAKKVWRIE